MITYVKEGMLIRLKNRTIICTVEKTKHGFHSLCIEGDDLYRGQMILVFFKDLKDGEVIDIPKPVEEPVVTTDPEKIAKQLYTWEDLVEHTNCKGIHLGNEVSMLVLLAVRKAFVNGVHWNRGGRVSSEEGNLF